MFRIASLQLVFDVLAKDNASSTFRQVGDSANKAGKQAESGLGRVSGAAKMLGGALIGAGIIGGFKSLFDAADESARITARTENVVAKMGNAANISARQVGDLAGAIAAKTGVDDEAIQSGQNLLLTFGNIRNEAGEGNDVFNQTSRLMVDMSRAMGKDASGSAIQLGKALNDPVKGITALSKAGVSFTEQQKEQIRTLVESGDVLGAQKIILGELEKQFGGAAEAMSTPLDRAKVAVGNLAEEMGGYLLPIVGDAADGLLGLIEGFKTGESTADGFQGAMQTTGAVLADVAGAVGDIAGVVGDVAGFFMDLPGPIQLGVTALGAFILLKGPVSDLFDTIALKALYARDAIGAAATSGVRGAAGGLLGLLGGPWGLALTGATIGLGFLVSALSKSEAQTHDTTAAERGFAEALKATNGVVDDSVRAAAAKAAQDAGLLDAAENAGVATNLVTDALLGNRAAYDEVAAALDVYANGRLIASGYEESGSDTLHRQADAAVRSRDEFASMAGVLPATVALEQQLAAATEETTTATGGAIDAQQAFQVGLEATSEAASDAQRETNMLKTALDVLTGANVSMIEVESALRESIADADGALKDLNGTVLNGTGQLNTQSEAGRAAADVLLGVRDSGNQLIATMVQQGATADEVRQRDAELRNSFINTAGQMGISQEAALRLADQILGIPAERETQITADTSQATGAVANLQAQIDGLRGRTVDIVARAIMPDLNGAASGSGRMGTYAEGGYTGDGGKYEPKGVVHGGEYVFTKEETAKAGPSALARLAKSLRGYATGGAVPPVSIAAELNARAYDTQMNALAQGVIDRYEPVQGFIGALQWAKSQVGRPYVWGGVGPGGYDCSGFMSAITNVIRGRNPHSRIGSTASFPWAGFGGGAGGMFSIGSSPNTGGGIGHMAGTLLGVNVESTGGVGVKVGGSARGANNGLFSTRASLYDNGGVLPPGLTLAMNGTGKPETIRTAEQEAALRGPSVFHLYDSDGVLMGTMRGQAESVVEGALVGVMSRGQYNG